MHDVETIFHLSYVLTAYRFFSEIRAMPVKVQIAVSRASLIFQKKIQMLLTLKGGSNPNDKYVL